MEKYVVFGPIVLFMGFFLLLVVAFLGFVAKLIFKAKNEDWKGEVVDKKSNSVRDQENPRKMNYFYWLEVKMEGGGVRKIGLAKEMWEKFEVGDRLHKPKGKLLPTKI